MEGFPSAEELARLGEALAHAGREGAEMASASAHASARP